MSEGDVPTLTDEELRELAGDLLKEGGLKMYHTGRLKKKDNPVEIMVNKMQEMLETERRTIGYHKTPPEALSYRC